MGRIRLRRTMTGEWLHQDVPMTLTLVNGLNGRNSARGTIPATFDVAAPDGAPLCLERATTLYVDDDDGNLEWAGLCSYSAPTRISRDVEFSGVLSLYDLIPYTQVASAWQPSLLDVLAHLLAVAHLEPHGTLQASLVDAGLPAATLGDPMPPPRPVKPSRNPGESRDDYQDRVLDWQAAADVWDSTYLSREPWSLAWWEHKYIGEVIRSLANGSPGFDLVESHHWAAPLDPVHRLVVGASVGVGDRPDVALVQGANLIGDLSPATNSGTYGNDMWVLGAGEGAAMQRARATVDDTRVRTTRFFDDKSEQNVAVLQAIADSQLALGLVTGATIHTAKAREGTLPLLQPGDWLPVKSDLFTGDVRVVEISKSTAGGPISLTFQTGTNRE